METFATYGRGDGDTNTIFDRIKNDHGKFVDTSNAIEAIWNKIIFKKMTTLTTRNITDI